MKKAQSQVIDDYESYLRTKSQPYVSYKVGSEDNIFDLLDIKEEWDYEPEIPDFETVIGEDKYNEVIGILPSMFVEFAVRMPDKKNNTYVPFSFEGRGYLRQIYDTPSKRTLLKCGRQVEKSTLLGNKLLSYACIVQALNCLYVSPTNQQTKVFSQDRLKEPVETSEYLKSWTTTKLSDNVFLKKFINRSQVTLRYCYMSADRCRGIPADVICIDELQDIMTDNIPIIEQCASHSPYKIYMYSGTPKSLDNTIEYYWTEFSTQNEWAVPCHRHSIMVGGGKISNAYWNILDETNIGRESLICDRCKHPINAGDERAMWVAMNPNIIHRIPKPYEGFRIPQIMVPWVPWEEIIQNQMTYPRGKFHNEVLGMSYDSGTRPLTRKDVMDNCDPNIGLDTAFQEKIRKHIAGTYPIYAGIDWGCYSEDTRTLTEHGFKYHWEIDETKDRIAQYNPNTGAITYVLPRKKIVFDHDGEMVHFKTNGQDILVTPDHKIMYRTGSRKESPWKEGEAQDVVGLDNVRFPEEGDWIGKDQEWFTIAGQQIEATTWLRFLGFLISEGCIYKNKTGYKGVALYQRDGNAVDQIQEVLNDLPFPHRHRYNNKTKDHIWDICGTEKTALWTWLIENVGSKAFTKRIPREFLELSRELLRPLFESLMLGDGTWDKRDTLRGAYSTTSEGLADDFLELAFKLGYRAKKSLHKKPVGNRKTQWRISLSRGREPVFHSRTGGITRVPYKGKAYCFSVPSGYFITERNGCIAQSGNTGENTFTVLSLGTYLQDRFTIIYINRFEGPESEPDIMMDKVMRDIDLWQVRRAGCDYGGGFWTNNRLLNRFGWERIVKYQYSTTSTKVKWDDGMKRYLVNRTEVMSDIFNAIKKRNVFRFPMWEQFQNPFGNDMLNIFSEFNEQRRENVYKKSPSSTDDAFHSILLCFLASMIDRPRPDIIAPMRDHKSEEVLY